MADRPIQRIGSIKTVEAFQAYVKEVAPEIPCDSTLESGPDSPMGKPIKKGDISLGNGFCLHPMEGWDGTTDGRPSEHTIRRWKHFGLSGAKLIWGGEAVAVQPDGRANPNQIMLNESTIGDFENLHQTLVNAHRDAMGNTDGLSIGIQLTHSGRYSKPNDKKRMEPLIAFRHPVLDKRLGITDDSRTLSDSDLRRIIDSYRKAAKLAEKVGFDWVDVKHCHGYLGHELLGGHTRPGEFGGSFENRTRYLREIISAIRAETKLKIGVRVSIFDQVPYKPDPAKSVPGKLGPGIPEEYPLPYVYGFGQNKNNPLEIDLAEPILFLELLRKLDIRLVNISAASPYYNPHLSRPAFYPPSDGYQPPEDPLIGVQRHLTVVRDLKQKFQDLILVGTGYTYLQDYLPHVAQAAVRAGWVDSVGLGRMVLSYPQLPLDMIAGKPLTLKKICRTFSDCTTAPRNGLISGCYPLDDHYAKLPEAVELKVIKKPKPVAKA